jgi:hypothetical protein
MMMRFVVSDSTRPGQYLDGGSLVEAALDDIRLWDEVATNVDEIDGVSSYLVYPNPANETVNLSFQAHHTLEDVVVEMVNHVGQVVFAETIAVVEDQFSMPIDVSDFAAGLYHITIKSAGKSNSKKLSIQK